MKLNYYCGCYNYKNHTSLIDEPPECQEPGADLGFPRSLEVKPI